MFPGVLSHIPVAHIDPSQSLAGAWLGCAWLMALNETHPFGLPIVGSRRSGCPRSFARDPCSRPAYVRYLFLTDVSVWGILAGKNIRRTFKVQLHGNRSSRSRSCSGSPDLDRCCHRDNEYRSLSARDTVDVGVVLRVCQPSSPNGSTNMRDLGGVPLTQDHAAPARRMIGGWV